MTLCTFATCSIGLRSHFGKEKFNKCMSMCILGYICFKEEQACIYKWMYLLGKTIYFSASLHALGMVVRRPNKSDMDQVQPHMTHTESKNSFKTTNHS